jgi:hypothetical protein
VIQLVPKGSYNVNPYSINQKIENRDLTRNQNVSEQRFLATDDALSDADALGLLLSPVLKMTFD